MKQVVAGFHKNFKIIPEADKKIKVEKLDISDAKEIKLCWK